MTQRAWHRIDLHTHSRYSDGTDDVDGLLTAARAARLDVLGLTDHDTVAGWTEAARIASRCGLAVVPGAEISTRHGGRSVHLLSYLHDPESAGLAAEIGRSVASRRTRARAMADRLAEDFPITWDDVVAQAAGEGTTLGRPHLADALVAAGVVPDRDAAFAGLLTSVSPYYVPYYAADTVHAIRCVREAGGVPVVAHPGGIGRGRPLGERDLEAMVDAGLLGLEVRHREHDEPTRERFAAFARRHDLIVTGSSDYHGAGKPNRLGENLTDPDMLARIVAAATGPTTVLT